MIRLYRYQRADGTEPFSEWLQSLRDKATQARIRVRLQRIASGNFGDIKSVGGGVSELRMHFGSGYRVYLAQYGKTMILLLCGGDKASQQKDIELAQIYLSDWKERQT
ncbi:MAG: type II toxin-antitoxin system RelE/ParE family toxin [Lamprobacter sp.]|uniref:type II toxin-antitoxin system RelE/ParE family toxin n=1 Tax=Lamprobacter sp. TaxID=3100796 RepID=UPI002B262DEA|nr:type II toxin-antitoxin system RelE/ParE family toxin [Lamprobacter sp.]MEA3640977.1 type II toxin-antitoxin system RelE/ParE family toxin [Lamprobacter sp.]